MVGTEVHQRPSSSIHTKQTCVPIWLLGCQCPALALSTIVKGEARSSDCKGSKYPSGTGGLGREVTVRFELVPLAAPRGQAGGETPLGSGGAESWA